ncbi:hypothetical protein D5086_011954 [Populus alba]|uniref:Uncharacterized protein n=1 Tax=Populus alba TaxID=43335 RepID=A0ACC4C219_POPAL
MPKLETLFRFGEDGAFFSFVDGVLDVYHLGSQALRLPFACFPLLKERNGRGVKVNGLQAPSHNMRSRWSLAILVPRSASTRPMSAARLNAGV